MSPAADRNLTIHRLRVPRAEISYLRFLLEAYDGLGVQVSESGSSLVTWFVPPSRRAEARALLEALRPEVGLQLLSQSDLR